MKKTTLLTIGLAASFVLGLYINPIIAKQRSNDAIEQKEKNMKLGAFSISLSVKDIKASKQFYENLGFTVFGGALEKNYLIMKNENSLIGLFQGMFQGNILTFNPGWDENAKNIEKFDDVREIQRQLKSKGFKIDNEADEKTSGPASFMITDPDGNVVLIDQHR
jgi:catechol 2,3-dioxygenase-like lactoylglutathione lyase family enzyme